MGSDGQYDGRLRYLLRHMPGLVQAAGTMSWPYYPIKTKLVNCVVSLCKETCCALDKLDVLRGRRQLLLGRHDEVQGRGYHTVGHAVSGVHSADLRSKSQGR